MQCMSPGVGELDVYPSIWGHWSGGPGGAEEDVKWLDERLARMFADSPERGETQGGAESNMKELRI